MHSVHQPRVALAGTTPAVLATNSTEHRQPRPTPICCPHTTCPKQYQNNSHLLRHLQTKAHCTHTRCAGCDKAEQLLSNKRKRDADAEVARRELEEKKRTKHDKIDEWLAAVKEKLVQDDAHKNSKNYNSWEEDRGHILQVVSPLH